jgi:hypothetical protein
MGNNNQSYILPQPISSITVQEKSNLLKADVNHLSGNDYFLKRIVKIIYSQYKNCTINSINRILYKNLNDEYYYIAVNITFPDSTTTDIYFSEILEFSYAPPNIMSGNLKTSDMGEELLYTKK